MTCVLNVKLNIISQYGNLNVILYVICLHSTANECKQVEKTHGHSNTHTHTGIKSPYATVIVLLIHPLAFVIKENGGVTGRKLRLHINKTDIPQNGPACTHTRTLLSCGVLRMCTALGLTPLALALRYRAKRLFLRPRSPLGREPLYLEEEHNMHRMNKKDRKWGGGEKKSTDTSRSHSGWSRLDQFKRVDSSWLCGGKKKQQHTLILPFRYALTICRHLREIWGHK